MKAKIVFVNAVSALRFPLAALTAWAMWAGRWEIAAAAYASGLVTDWIDGPIARALKAETEFGREWMEPAADLALLAGGIVGLVLIGIVPWWALALLAVGDRCVNYLVKPRVKRPQRILFVQAVFLEGTIAVISVFLLYRVDPRLAVAAVASAPIVAYAKRRRIREFAAWCFRE